MPFLARAPGPSTLTEGSNHHRCNLWSLIPWPDGCGDTQAKTGALLRRGSRCIKRHQVRPPQGSRAVSTRDPDAMKNRNQLEDIPQQGLKRFATPAIGLFNIVSASKRTRKIVVKSRSPSRLWSTRIKANHDSTEGLAIYCLTKVKRPKNEEDERLSRSFRMAPTD